MGAAPAPHVFIIPTSLLDACSKLARLEFQGPGREVIILEFILRLKINHKQPFIALYFESQVL